MIASRMNMEAAQEALALGLTLSHSYFTPSEWIKQSGSMLVFEDGCRCRPREFWATRADFPDTWYAPKSLNPNPETYLKRMEECNNAI